MDNLIYNYIDNNPNDKDRFREMLNSITIIHPRIITVWHAFRLLDIHLKRNCNENNLVEEIVELFKESSSIYQSLIDLLQKTRDSTWCDESQKINIQISDDDRDVNAIVNGDLLRQHTIDLLGNLLDALIKSYDLRHINRETLINKSRQYRNNSCRVIQRLIDENQIEFCQGFRMISLEISPRNITLEIAFNALVSYLSLIPRYGVVSQLLRNSRLGLVPGNQEEYDEFAFQKFIKEIFFIVYEPTRSEDDRNVLFQFVYAIITEIDKCIHYDSSFGINSILIAEENVSDSDSDDMEETRLENSESDSESETLESTSRRNSESGMTFFDEPTRVKYFELIKNVIKPDFSSSRDPLSSNKWFEQCNNSKDIISQMEWEADDHQSMDIIFIQWGINGVIECYNADNIKHYLSIEDSLVVQWYKRPESNLRPDEDAQGYGWTPQASADVILKLWPLNYHVTVKSLVSMFNSNKRKFLAMPYAQFRVGNIKGLFGEGNQHAQLPEEKIYELTTMLI